MLEFHDVNFTYLQKKIWNPFQRKKEIPSPVLQSVQLSIGLGELFGIIGPNGSGKTTMAKLLMGVLEPTEGLITYKGEPRPKLQKNTWKLKLGFVSGATSKLFSTMTVEEHIVIYSSLYGSQFNSQYLKQKFKECHLSDKLSRTPGQLSFGERMKCEIVLTLATQPQILILDEPTVGLDVIAIDHIRQLISSYVDENQCTGFLTSHNLQDISSLCNQYGFLKEGRIFELKNSEHSNGKTLEDEYRSIYG